MKISIKILKKFLPLAFVITMLIGAVYLQSQQQLRQSANDPQIQMATDIADQLAKGTTYTQFTSGPKIEISKSLATNISIFDANKKLISSNAFLNGKAIDLPTGVLDAAKTKNPNPNMVTWQPEPGVRQAAVVSFYTNGHTTEGYVLVSRSLTNSESRDSQNLNRAILFGLATLAGTFVIIVILELLANRQKKVRTF